MPSAITDLYDRVTDSTTGRPVISALASGKALAAPSITLTDATNWTVTTAIHFSIYTTVTAGGLTVKDTTSQTDWKGTLAGTTISNMTLTGGTDRTYVAGAIVELTPTARYAKDLYELISAHANADGSLKTAPIQTALGLGTGTLNGWNVLGYTPNTITANGNHSYNMVYNSVDLTGTISNGQRLKGTRTVTAPTQCTSLNGTTQYYSKTTPNKMAWTNNFVVSQKVKPSAYQLGVFQSRFDGTNGWIAQMLADGRVQLNGFSGGGANGFAFTSYQSIPLNKWSDVAIQLDMSVTTNSATTNYIMIDGADVPGVATRTGTNPTSLVQAGNYQIGAQNGATTLFAGKIVQVASYNAKVTQATILASMNQPLTGSETSIASAYSFSNSIVDLNTTTPNDLTANGSAVATTLDTPFTQTTTGITTGTTNFAIITAISFSTNTTVTVQVPEGDTLPTSGGISAVSYSSQKAPYGFPAQQDKWQIITISKGANTNNGASTGDTYYNVGSFYMSVPVGAFKLKASVCVQSSMGSTTSHGAGAGIGTTAGNSRDVATNTASYSTAVDCRGTAVMEANVVNTVATTYYINIGSVDQAAAALYLVGATNNNTFIAELAYL